MHEDELSDQQRAELAQQITTLRRTIRQTIDEAEALTETVTLDQASVGRVSRIDAIQQQAMAKEAVRRHRVRLDRLEAAAHRLESDPEEFGWCMDCGELIPYRRLLAYPESVYCVPCAQARGR